MYGRRIPMPRVPEAYARQLETLPLKPYKVTNTSQVLGIVISLRQMCAKWWIELIQYILRRNVTTGHLFSLQRYLSEIPAELRCYIVHTALKAGGLYLDNSSREMPCVNKALVFASSDILIRETVYLTIPKYVENVGESSPEVELLIRSGEGVLKLVLVIPENFRIHIKKTLTDLFRTCSHLTSVTIHNSNDDALKLLTRYCRRLQFIDVSESKDVTDEGISFAVVNLKWASDSLSLIKTFDVGGTSCTPNAVFTLLTTFPSLTCLGSTNIMEVIEDVVNEFGGDSIVSKLETIHLKGATVNRLKTLRKFCPNIKNVTITFNEHAGATLNDLRLLPEIVRLDITVRDPFILSPANLHDLVWNMGPKLLELKISGDVFWDVDMGILVGQCPFIKVLFIPSVTFLTRDSLLVLQAKNTTTMTFLTELNIDCMMGAGQKSWAKDFTLLRNGLILALRRCKHLRRLLLRPTQLVDTDLVEILCENRLLHLEVLELYNSVLGLSSATLLVDTCVNLHIMKGLKSWRGMTLFDIVSLRQYSRGHRRIADIKILF